MNNTCKVLQGEAARRAKRLARSPPGPETRKDKDDNMNYGPASKVFVTPQVSCPKSVSSVKSDWFIQTGWS